MLTALKADPRRCGFRSEQIRRTLETMNGADLHQESGGVRHLLYLLGKAAHGNPEVMKLRFDPQASRLEDYPQALKNRLLGIFLEHAEGALHREQGSFREFDASGES
jgi:hypothetical protein